MEKSMLKWICVCKLADIVPNTGVCALLGGAQVAVFHVAPAAVDGPPRVFAIDNFDANSGASVLSRGLVGSIGERIVVASPIYKQHFDLATGECIEEPQHSVTVWPVKLEDGQIWVGSTGTSA